MLDQQTIDFRAAFKEKGRIEKIIADVEKEAAKFQPDLSTHSGRAKIASEAHKVRKVKTAIDSAGKELTDEWRKKVDAVNAVRRLAKDRLGALAAQIRKPLDDWEAEEEARKERIEARFQRLRDLAVVPHGSTSDDVRERLAEVLRLFGANEPDPWGERKDEAFDLRAATEESLNIKLDQIKHEEAERARAEAERQELERLRREQAEREEAERRAAAEKERQEREEQLQREAAERAREEAERQAEEARQKAEREAQERLSAAERAQREAEERANRAAEEERRRIAAEQEAKRKAEEKRQANKRHRDKVRKEAVAAITGILGGHDADNMETADGIFEAIDRGEVPHVTINY